jgi:ribosomal protein S14
MRKKSTKRVPQDIKPWVRVREVDNDQLYVPGKKTTRWVAGGRRDWDTKVLNAAAARQFADILVKSLIITTGHEVNTLSENYLNKLNLKLRTATKMRSLTKYKNYCLLSGRGRTYNRSFYIARHNMRKLVGTGLISGLIK